MLKKFRNKSFSIANKILLAKASDVIDRYHAEGITMTLRQLYYQLVASDVIPNNIKAYKHITSLITDARYAGMIDWDAIDDNLRKPKMPNTFKGVPELLQAAVDSYKLNFWKGMDNYVELYTEKDALSSVLAPIASAYRIPFQVNRGYASASSMFEAACRFMDINTAHKKHIILYLGDHDPSGLDMVRDIEDRLSEFGARIEIRHIALTRAQIDQYNPPPNPAKLTDVRARGYIEEHGNQSWECDALPPNVMNKIVKDAIEEYLDRDIYDEVIKREKAEKKELLDFAKKHKER